MLARIYIPPLLHYVDLYRDTSRTMKHGMNLFTPVFYRALAAHKLLLSGFLGCRDFV